MAGRGTSPDFVEALARGLDVLTCFGEVRPTLTLAEVAAETGLARPTARRLLLTLQELGYVRIDGGSFALTPRVLRLGHGLRRARSGCGTLPARTWPTWSRDTHESSSMAQLDGSDIVYVARVAVPKIITLAGDHRHPIPGAADLAGQGAARRARAGRTHRGAGRAEPVGAAAASCRATAPTSTPN